jgi:hypothetical protein
MSNASARLDRIETRLSGGSGDIAVWCDNEGDMAATIDAMIAEGEIAPTDRPRCVHWTKARAAPRSHETALDCLARGRAE